MARSEMDVRRSVEVLFNPTRLSGRGSIARSHRRAPSPFRNSDPLRTGAGHFNESRAVMAKIGFWQGRAAPVHRDDNPGNTGNALSGKAGARLRLKSAPEAAAALFTEIARAATAQSAL